MALAHYALSSRLPPSPNNPMASLKPQCSVSSPASSRPTKRKNHLRPKLLKPLTKPLPVHPLPHTPQHRETQIDSTQSLQSFEEIPQVDSEDNKLGLQEAQLQVPEISQAETVVPTWSVTQLVLYVVGLFVVQTVVTVWMWSREKGEEGAESGLDGEKKEGFWFNRDPGVEEESVVYTDESELERRILEIRAMAREVREGEAKKLIEEATLIGVNGIESVAEAVDVKASTGIQKEVEGKLTKLMKRLNADKPVGSINSYLKNSEGAKESEVTNAEVSEEIIVLESKSKLDSNTLELNDDSREYQSDTNGNVINGNSDGTAFVNKVNRSGDDIPNVGSRQSVLEVEDKTPISDDTLLEKTASELEGKKEMKDTSGKGFGTTLNVGRTSEKERRSLKKRERIEKVKSSSSGIRENNRELVEPRNSSQPKSKSSTSATRSIEQKQVVSNSKDKQMSTENGMWWSHLPYVLAILLRRTSEDEGPGGLYSLKMGDDDSESHIIAFEDQRDASNFCYILDAFFAELGDMTADVVPLSTEELKDEVEASTMKIIVVRKGQLQLYAGQPLADVEMTIRSLV